MAAEIERTIGATSELVPSSGGVFEVFADEKRIFSKKSLGRFPEDGEVVGLLRSPA